MNAQPLTLRHRPRILAEVVGHAGILAELRAWLNAPCSAAMLLTGPPGTGKTSLAWAVAGELGCNANANAVEREMSGFREIASGSLNADAVRSTWAWCHESTWTGRGWHVVLFNECDAMSDKADSLFCDVLESLPAKTLFIFTSNAASFPRRFRDRCQCFTVSAPGNDNATRAAAQSLIDRVWQAELGRNHAPALADLGPGLIEDGQLSYRAVVSALERRLRAEADYRPDNAAGAIVERLPGIVETVSESVVAVIEPGPVAEAIAPPAPPAPWQPAEGDTVIAEWRGREITARVQCRGERGCYYLRSDAVFGPVFLPLAKLKPLEVEPCNA